MEQSVLIKGLLDICANTARKLSEVFRELFLNHVPHAEGIIPAITQRDALLSNREYLGNPHQVTAEAVNDTGPT